MQRVKFGEFPDISQYVDLSANTDALPCRILLMNSVAILQPNAARWLEVQRAWRWILTDWLIRLVTWNFITA